MDKLRRKIILAFRMNCERVTRSGVEYITRRFLLNGFSPEDVTYSMAELEVLQSLTRNFAVNVSGQVFSYAKVTNKF